MKPPKHSNHKVTDIGHGIQTIETSRCPLCNYERAEDKKKKLQIEKYLKSAGAKKAYKSLNTLMDKLYDAGVDVSYFPHAAQVELAKYAYKISKIK